MSYIETIIYGYGCEVTFPTNDKSIEKLIAFAPEYKEKIFGILEKNSIDKPEVSDYLEYGKICEEGLATILSEVIFECENLFLTACSDYNCYNYLVYEPSYPWTKSGGFVPKSPEDIERIIKKYVAVLNPNVDVKFGYLEIHNGG